jgi:hypothetical protein
MNARRSFPRRWIAVAACLLWLQGCFSDNSVAGGSSEVDNPQIKVAFIDSTGATVAFTGSLSLYLSDQNPTLDPDPLAEVLLDSDTVVYVSAARLKKAGASASFSLFAQGSAGSGALVKRFFYDTASGKISVNGIAAAKLVVPLVPLVQYTATVNLDVNGPERVFVPGSPLQAVVVADSFAFDDVPQGVFPLRVYSSGGVEREFPDSLDTRHKGHFDLDTTSAPPIPRPPSEEPQQLKAQAGTDQSVAANAEIFLSGKVTGVSKSDSKRMGILWRQLPPDSGGKWAYIESPSSLNTRVYAWPGVYRFVLSVSVGSKKAEDTVTIAVQQQPAITFYKPDQGQPVWGGYPFHVEWHGANNDTLNLELSRDSAATWQPVTNNVLSWEGYNGYWSYKGYSWSVPAQPAANCFLRFRKNGVTVATSARFSIVTPPPPPY